MVDGRKLVKSELDGSVSMTTARTAQVSQVGGEAQRGKAQQILKAAAEIFMDQGYGAASMDAIARRAGVSKATLYAHFQGKEQLFAAIVAEQCQRIAREVTMAESDLADLRGGLLAIGRNFLERITSPHALAIHRIVVAEAARFPELGQVFYETGPSQLMTQLARFLAAAADRSELEVSAPHRAAEHFLGLIRGDLHLRCVLGLVRQPDAAEIDRIVADGVGVFWRAYGPVTGRQD